MTELRLRNYILVKFDWIGFHHWPDAPAAVKYLRDMHRHKFFAEIMLEVTHDDRELEFHLVVEDLKARLAPLPVRNAQSCEQMAEVILLELLSQHGEDRYCRVVVLEDNENGGVVEWNPDQQSSKSGERHLATQSETPGTSPPAGQQSLATQ